MFTPALHRAKDRRSARAVPLLPGIAAAIFALGSAPAAPPQWRYEVNADPDLQELRVEATFPPGSPEELSVESGTEPFVREVLVAEGDRFIGIEPRGTSWFVPSCAARGCRIRYRFALARAAADLDSTDLAIRYPGVVESPPGAWLLRPLAAKADARVQLRVQTEAGMRFVTGLPPSASGSGYALDAIDLPRAPYSAFGAFTSEKFDVDKSTVEIAFVPTERQIGSSELARWIRGSAQTLAGYFGRLPLDHLLVLVLPSRGERVHGRVLGGGGATVLLWLGPDVTRAALDRDWVLVHELAHLGFPTVPRRQHWAEEGMATYVEPLARAKAGQVTADKVWGDLISGLPQGLPQQGDKGLDRTPTWGRTYWGGALFWFLADIDIRERTGNRHSVGDALRGIAAAGGTIAHRWDLVRALQAGDRAIGVPALEALYAKMGSDPMNVDLGALFKRLGVAIEGRKVVFDDEAPLAAIRRSITGAERRPLADAGRE